jgi:hypothetical protein
MTIMKHFKVLKSSIYCFPLDIHILQFSNLADTLIQSNLQDKLGLSALLKDRSTVFAPSQLRELNQQPFGYCPKALNRHATLTINLLITSGTFIAIITILSGTRKDSGQGDKPQRSPHHPFARSTRVLLTIEVCFLMQQHAIPPEASI